MKITKIQVVLLAVLAGGILVLGSLFFLREPIREGINGFRAVRLQEKAEAAFAEGLWEQASRQGQAAHYLDPENGDIALLIARSTLKQRMQNSVSWWKRAIDHPEIPIDELQQLTGILLNGGNIEDGLLFLNRLVELAPNDPGTRRLWLISLQKQQRIGNAMNLAAQMAASGSEDWDIHRYFMAMQENLLPGVGEEAVIQHLQALVEADVSLSVAAARELATKAEAPRDLRLQATRYLKTHAKDDLDLLYAQSLEVKENERKRETLLPLLNRLLEAPDEGVLSELLRWSQFMRATEWFLDNVSWKNYRESGGQAEPYLRILLENGKLEALVELTEGEYSGGEQADGSTFLYYRALALEQMGKMDEAEAALNLALQVADPEASDSLERYLSRDSRWDSLIRLYNLVLEARPGDQFTEFKLLVAHYFLGNQADLIQLLKNLDTEDYKGQPGQASFLLYLRLVLDGYSAELHKEIEGFLSRYPQISDFRPILGLSYLLQGQPDVAGSLIRETPELDLGMPRYMRVAAIILGRPRDKYLVPGEIEYLLTREQYLLSRFSSGSNP